MWDVAPLGEEQCAVQNGEGEERDEISEAEILCNGGQRANLLGQESGGAGHVQSKLRLSMVKEGWRTEIRITTDGEHDMLARVSYVERDNVDEEETTCDVIWRVVRATELAHACRMCSSSVGATEV